MLHPGHATEGRVAVSVDRQFALMEVHDVLLVHRRASIGARQRNPIHGVLRKISLLYDMQLTRVPKRLPVVLSPGEVEKLIAAAPNIRYRTMLLLLYATGLRRAEASRLKIADIDSQRAGESCPHQRSHRRCRT
jgi:integrase